MASGQPAGNEDQKHAAQADVHAKAPAPVQAGVQANARADVYANTHAPVHANARAIAHTDTHTDAHTDAPVHSPGKPACQGLVTRERDAYGYTFAINVRCAAPFGAWGIWRRMRVLPGIKPLRGPTLLHWRAQFEYLGKPYQAVALPGRLWIGALAPADLYRETDTLYDLLREALHGLE